MTAGNAEKPEVMRLVYRGAEYKCWAASEAEMVEMIVQIDALKQEMALREEKNQRLNVSFSSAERWLLLLQTPPRAVRRRAVAHCSPPHRWLLSTLDCPRGRADSACTLAVAGRDGCVSV